MVSKVGHLSRILLRKKQVFTRAVFWRIPHNTGEPEVNLKLGRYRRGDEFGDPDQVDEQNPKSELTLNTEELAGLVAFLQENYEPFKQGVRAFIPLDKPFSQDNAVELRKLFALPNREALVSFLLESKIIPDAVYASVELAKRIKAIDEFSSMLGNNYSEHAWQKWFEENNWVLGSEFVSVLEERRVDAKNIADYLMKAYDGFLDIVEIKKPEASQEFWARSPDHGNYYPSTELVKAISQANNYIYEVERESNSQKFIELVGIKAIKPRGVLIFGRSHNWNVKQCEAYRLLNCSYHAISILTYDHVLERAKRMCGVVEKSTDFIDDDNIPF